MSGDEPGFQPTVLPDAAACRGGSRPPLAGLHEQQASVPNGSTWLTDLILLSRRKNSGANNKPRAEVPPVDLVNGTEQPHDLWDRFAPDAREYELALALLALGATADDAAIESATDHGLRSRIVDLLPDLVRRMLVMLALHERPLPESHLERFHEAGTTATLGTAIGLWRRMPSGLLVEQGWSRWWRTRLDEARQRAVHGEIAELFASQAYPGDPEAGRAGLALLEAHRHFLAAGEIDRARAYARYGAALLVEAARSRSIAGCHLEAAHLYEPVVSAADEGRLPVSRRLRAYARHYLHFNRAHAGAEGLRATERGYRQALDEWPDNALFRSRLVRVLFYDSRPAEALGELSAAQTRVPEHPQKQTILVARTVRGLLRKKRDRVLDAILAWSGYEPDTEQARDVEHQFAERLRAGWMVRHLAFDAGEPLFFTDPQQVRIERLSSGWIAELPALRTAEKGVSPVEALRALVGRVREEASALIRAYTADLEPNKRIRKQQLLGVVDVVASRVDAPAAEALWVFGDLERRDGRIWLHTGGVYDLWFEVPDDIARGLTVDDLPHFALVKTDAGVPRGPVQELEPGLRRPADELWEQWRRRLSDAG